MSTPQLALFDFLPPFWLRLVEQKERIMKFKSAPQTLRAYGYNWRTFCDWCASVGASSLPATPETVIQYTTWALYEREPKPYRLATVEVAHAAITRHHHEAKHLSPITQEVHAFLAGARRDLKEKQRRPAAMPPKTLRRICQWYLAQEDRLLFRRDRAMLLVQFAAGWRESEVVGLKLEDIEFVRRKVILSLGASKTDQTGAEGRVVPIDAGIHRETDPVRALRSWLEVRGNWQGPLFCRIDRWTDALKPKHLNSAAPNQRLKFALEQIGEDPLAYSSHSLRAGMVTTSILRGASESAIMLRTGHHDLASMRKYIRAGQAIATAVDPLAGVL